MIVPVACWPSPKSHVALLGAGPVLLLTCIVTSSFTVGLVLDSVICRFGGGGGGGGFDVEVVGGGWLDVGGGWFDVGGLVGRGWLVGGRFAGGGGAGWLVGG